jgi:hypothetical protein
VKIFGLTVLLGAATVLLTGCDEDKYTLKFSHYIHVTDNEMDCDECHGEVGEPSFMAITHESCTDCHDEPEAKEISMETCGYCHQEKHLPNLAAWKAEPVEPLRNIFVHTEALSGKCQDCHADLFAENLSSVPKLNQNDIVNIRDEAHSSGQDCLACHTDMAPDQAPADHDLVWMKRHGTFGMQDDAACGVCHAEESCRECHSSVQPMSHNNMFRLKTHGTLASWNRESCMVCHEEDSCVSCHSEARPRSHNGRWSAAPGAKYTPGHCVGCHESASEGEGCMVCHEGANDVVALHEDYWPDDLFHGVLLNCYDCHLFPLSK